MLWTPEFEPAGVCDSEPGQVRSGPGRTERRRGEAGAFGKEAQEECLRGAALSLPPANNVIDFHTNCVGTSGLEVGPGILADDCATAHQRQTAER